MGNQTLPKSTAQKGVAVVVCRVTEPLAAHTDPWTPGLAQNSVDSPRLRHHQPWCLYACGGAPDFMDCFCQIGGNSWQYPPQISQILYVSVLTGSSPIGLGWIRSTAPQQCSTALERQSAFVQVLMASKGLRLATAPCGAQHDQKACKDRGLALLDTNHLLS